MRDYCGQVVFMSFLKTENNICYLFLPKFRNVIYFLSCVKQKLPQDFSSYHSLSGLFRETTGT